MQGRLASEPSLAELLCSRNKIILIGFGLETAFFHFFDILISFNLFSVFSSFLNFCNQSVLDRRPEIRDATGPVVG